MIKRNDLQLILTEIVDNSGIYPFSAARLNKIRFEVLDAIQPDYTNAMAEILPYDTHLEIRVIQYNQHNQHNQFDDQTFSFQVQNVG